MLSHCLLMMTGRVMKSLFLKYEKFGNGHVWQKYAVFEVRIRNFESEDRGEPLA